nr:RNA-directed DNA polymerase homolog [Tanacetum cinerariifolium]
MCINYRKSNNTTRKDHFPLPFIDQMLERLAGHEYYCFLDRFSRYFQIPIAPEDQEKTTFTSPSRTIGYKQIPFGLCNAPTTFQRCMTTIFHELIEDIMEAPIMIKPDWSLPFEVMCDVSDYAVRAVVGHRIDKHFKPIHYALKTINEAQGNYTTIEKDFGCSLRIRQVPSILGLIQSAATVGIPASLLVLAVLKPERLKADRARNE